MSDRQRAENRPTARRRQVLRASAWSAPVAVVAVAAPAFATSPGVGTFSVTSFSVGVSKRGNTIAYQVTFTYDANDGASATYDLTLTTNPPTGNVLTSGPRSITSGQSVTVGPGETGPLGTGTYTLVLTITPVGGAPQVFTSEPVTITP